MSNQARAKGTLVGTAAGGAIGGFAGYQGAQSEITNRWTAAVREYEDSLSNFVCMTGARYLSKYNDYVQIPEMKKNSLIIPIEKIPEQYRDKMVPLVLAYKHK